MEIVKNYLIYNGDQKNSSYENYLLPDFLHNDKYF